MTATAKTPLTVSGLSAPAKDNPVIRISAQSGGTLCWNGGEQNVVIAKQATADKYEVRSILLTPLDGWEGEITDLSWSSTMTPLSTSLKSVNHPLTKFIWMNYRFE